MTGKVSNGKKEMRWIRVEVSGYVDVLVDTGDINPPESNPAYHKGCAMYCYEHLNLVKESILEDGVCYLTQDGYITGVDDHIKVNSIYSLAKKLPR